MARVVHAKVFDAPVITEKGKLYHLYDWIHLLAAIATIKRAEQKAADKERRAKAVNEAPRVTRSKAKATIIAAPNASTFNTL